MIFSKIKLFGLLVLSYSVVACGQAQVSTAPNATPSPIAQPTVAAQPTESLVIVEESPGPQSSEPITEAIADTPQKYLWISPAGNSPFYTVNTCGVNAEAYMTPNEFIKIVQSLEFLP